ncbi:MAG: Gx transporter family protein [Candidatus Cloacimonas sp.]|jgi:heptaprenyl diphosphate synthase|nr:Gx transporter family protein [Candidatus Cloacimonas sp.]
MNIKHEHQILQLAFLTAAAASIHIVESLIMRLSPIPFLRIGLSNVVLLYLIARNQPLSAIMVSTAKSVIGGIVTLTLLSPTTILSLAGGLTAIIAMLLAKWLKLGLSLFGISIIGAITHNLTQLAMVRLILIHSDRVFMLTPILISIGLLSGCIIAYISLYVDAKFSFSGMKKIDEKL